jgi:SNF2 family DNA or RNA helicase
MDTSSKQQTERAASAPARNGTTITRAGTHLRIAFPYDPAKLEIVRALPDRKFDGTAKVWIVPAKHLAAVVAAFPSATLAGDLGAELQSATVASEAAERARVAAVADGLARYETIKPTWLYEHQDVGIRWLIESRKAILADDMGLGKTTQALVAARAIGHRIIVLAPAGLRDNWLREAAKVGARIEIYSWAKVPESFIGDYTLIADEAHYAQNMKAQRTKRYLALASAAQAHFALTGTPIKNGRPANLFPLLVAIAHPLAQNRKAYEMRYCDAGPTRWSQWDVTGAAHLDELHAKISDSMLRRMKYECLDLPAKTRVWRDAELSADALEMYRAELARMQAEYRARVAEGEIAEADALVMLGHLAHAGSLGKVDAAVEMAEEIVEQGGQVVLFTRFVDSATALAAKLEPLGVGKITGAENSAQRQLAIDEFQAGVRKVMVCTLGAGNVGITLTAAQTVILVDRPWTPGDAVQAEDRLHRIGQTNAVTAYWLQHGQFDAWLDGEVLQGKQERAELVMGGEAKVLEVERRPRTAREFAREVFGE